MSPEDVHYHRDPGIAYKHCTSCCSSWRGSNHSQNLRGVPPHHMRWYSSQIPSLSTSNINVFGQNEHGGVLTTPPANFGPLFNRKCCSEAESAASICKSHCKSAINNDLFQGNASPSMGTSHEPLLHKIHSPCIAKKKGKTWASCRKLLLICLFLVIVLSLQFAAVSFLMFQKSSTNKQESKQHSSEDYRGATSSVDVALNERVGRELVVLGNSTDLAASLATQRMSTLQSFTWKGQIEFKVLFELLQQASFLETLILENTDDQILHKMYSNDRNSMRQVPIVLGNLKKLVLKNFSSSPGKLDELLSNIGINGLQEVAIEKSTVDTSNLAVLENMLIYNRETLQKILFLDTLIPSCSFANGSFIFPKLLELRLSLEQGKIFPLKANFSQVFPNLSKFSLKSGKIDYDDIPELLTCSNIQDLYFDCVVPMHITTVDLRFFRNAPSSLKSAEIGFEFEAKQYGTGCSIENSFDSSIAMKLTTYSNC